MDRRDTIKFTGKLLKINENPEIYLKNNPRFLDLTDDYLWLAMVDILIESGYAFEIDWKEDYSTAKNQTEILLKNKSVSIDIEKDQDLYHLEAGSFFPLLNEKIEKSGYQLLNLDIDSDSYVSILVNDESINKLLSLDDRIKEYR
ncbi:hypothetical protein EG346_20725 [Chryseobacterium carnipullorum]|uniref:DUF6630 domain-containing protein n=1 Tax=Chryseobacterium carnipullorum TaxID=1124835 RepID=A0A3G6MAG5_CHRCU|nr:DUF6630 family protein [Chryseobacterium carnipullorum]AZA50455.1 hypothetical protein EG346_20725 [Chryseobacterium carnipullorum]